jgi:hypothetical protein
VAYAIPAAFAAAPTVEPPSTNEIAYAVLDANSLPSNVKAIRPSMKKLKILLRIVQICVKKLKKERDAG